MATRSRIEIDGINLYSHWDGYPSGMAVKICKALDHMYKKDDWRIEKINFFNSFIAGNIDNCKIDLNRSIGGLEYSYLINTENMTIKTYTTNWESDKESFYNELSIYDFIKNNHREINYNTGEKYSIFDDGDFIVKVIEVNEYTKKENISLMTKKGLKLHIEDIKESLKKYDRKNPNRKQALKKLVDLRKSEKITKNS